MTPDSQFYLKNWF